MIYLKKLLSHRLVPALLLTLSALSVAAQKETVTIDAQNMPLRELLNLIEKKSPYTFAFADADLPLDKKVNLKAENRSISSILREVLPNASVKVENNKILLSANQQKAAAAPAKKQEEKKTTAPANDKGWNLSGTVVDEKGEPLIGATVMQKGVKNGASTDIEGRFTLRVKEAHPTLVVRYVGYTPTEVKGKKGEDLHIALKANATELGELVVTSLGITREQKSLGYAVTKVDSDDLNKSVSGNWLNNLDGKVAGLSATGAGSGPTGSMRVVLRGDQSLNYGNNEALFVVDGVPITSGDQGTGTGTSYNSDDSPVDFGNGASEINPEDIESVTVLKGPAATALYGSRAANGAIVITTKSGKKSKGIGVTLNSSVTFERAGYFPEFQKVYGPGTGLGFYTMDYWTFSGDVPEGFSKKRGDGGSRLSYGEAFGADKLRNQYNSYNWETGEYTLTPFVYADDWYTGLFKTGTTFKNNATISSNNGKGTTARISITDTRNNWILPNTGYQNQTISLSFATNMNKWIKLTAKVNYLHKSSDNTPTTGYNSQSPFYFLIWGTTNNSIQLYKDEYFNGRCTQENYDAGGKDGHGMVASRGNSQPNNPYRILYECTNSINKDRVYGNALVTINFPVKGLTLDLRAGTDFSAEFRQQKKPFRTKNYLSGFYREQNFRDIETNIDFLLKYINNELFNERFGLSAAFGGNNMSRRLWRSSITLDRLGEEGVYNSTNTPTGEYPRTSFYRSQKVVNSFYGFVNASWDDTYFLDLTARNDWSSTLGRGNWSFFYPSVSASALLDQTFKLHENAPWLNMLKLRASWANVGNDTNPYTLVDGYTAVSAYPGSYTLPTERSNYYIKPENVESYEVGIETKMFENRLGLDIAFYNSSTTNQIVSAVTDPIIGSSSKKINCGEIRNRGIEIAVHGVPIRTKDFTWSIDVNWSRNWNKLISLEDGWDPRTPYQLAQGIVGNYANIYSFIGEEMNWIYGIGYQRAPEGATYIDENGNEVSCAGMKLVNVENGMPVLDDTPDRRIAKINPTWRGGLSMNFRYKDFTLGMNFTAQMGGHTYSVTHAQLSYMGKLANSLEGRADGLVVEGVNAITNEDGTVTYQLNRTITSSVEDYYNKYKWHPKNVEENTFKTDFLKLKEIRLDYNLPARICRKTKVIQGLSVGAYATNIFCITQFPQYDPEAGTLVGTNVINGIEAGAFPMTRTYGINLKLSF